jgi:predicted ATPase
VVDTGFPELVLVSGYSGIGKSSLVQEIQKPLVKERGFFLGGKFDQLARGIPYSTVVKALTELVTGLLAEGEPRLRVWREEIQEALGTNGKLITDVIPRLKLLIGDQPAVPELPLTAAEQRFHRAFRDFLGVFTRKEHPLVLFLDDLQWADAGSLRLIEDVITHPHTRYLLLIGAYRDNEVDPSHPLMRMLERIRKTPAVLKNVALPPLAMEHVTELVADTVRAEPARARPLAALVREKTGGTRSSSSSFSRRSIGSSSWSWTKRL